ncbi:MAG: zinc ribbon domain-containing protein, partial [Thomasclavelia spiroformis]
LQQLKYKCENVGINYIEQEESYTSGTSFLDEENPIKENYNKNRRIQRGLFKSNSGLLINSDVNGSFQIMKKVFPNAISRYGIEGVLTPIVINVA